MDNLGAWSKWEDHTNIILNYTRLKYISTSKKTPLVDHAVRGAQSIKICRLLHKIGTCTYIKGWRMTNQKRPLYKPNHYYDVLKGFQVHGSCFQKSQCQVSLLCLIDLIRNQILCIFRYTYM